MHDMRCRVPQVLTDDQRLVADYLHDRLIRDAAQRHHSVRLYVALLGAQDTLWPEPEPVRHPDIVDAGARGVLPVYLTGSTVLIGPLGGERPCFRCLARRWQLVRNGAVRDALESGRPVAAHRASPFLTRFALEAVWQSVRHTADVPPAARPTDRHGHPFVRELRLKELTVRRYPIVADSQCPRCGVSADDSAEAARVVLRSRTKRSIDDFRINSVAGYDLDQDAYVNPVCGVAGTGADPGLTSTTTAHVKGHVGIRGGGYIQEALWAGHSDSFARSALLGIMEAHERIAGTQPRRFSKVMVDTYRNLRDAALDPAECGLYSEDFYAASRHYVPYHPDLAIPWVWGFSLRDDRPILVPASITYYHLIDQVGRFVQECSNGCASGGHFEEAILHATLELIERDAFLIAWYAKPRLPEIDPHSCTTVRSRLMMNRISMYGYDIRLYDARIEFPIPVVIVVAQRRDSGMGTLIFGSGASFDPEAAIASGLYEVASAIPEFADYTESHAQEIAAKAEEFDRVLSLSDHAALFGLPEMSRYAAHLLGDGRPAGLHPVTALYQDWQRNRPRTLDLLDDLNLCVQSVVKAGFDLIVVDQTTPEQEEIPIRTASVVIPGLLPIDFGWSRQRALHMPRTRTVLNRVGWLDHDLEAAELNRAPHPFP
jgi:ribosomal protein S12 methylthiotransferase accessory factor